MHLGGREWGFGPIPRGARAACLRAIRRSVTIVSRRPRGAPGRSEHANGARHAHSAPQCARDRARSLPDNRRHGLFASRRSPVRSRLAPLPKWLQLRILLSFDDEQYIRLAGLGITIGHQIGFRLGDAAGGRPCAPGQSASLRVPQATAGTARLERSGETPSGLLRCRRSDRDRWLPLARPGVADRIARSTDAQVDSALDDWVRRALRPSNSLVVQVSRSCAWR